MCSFPTGIFCLHHWGRIVLPFITGEGIFFPFPQRKESSLLPRCGWGRNFLPFITGEGIFFLYYWGKNFLPFRTTEGVFFTSPLWLGKEFPSLLTGEGIFFPSYWGRNFLPFLLGKEFSSLYYWGRNLHHWGRKFVPFLSGVWNNCT